MAQAQRYKLKLSKLQFCSLVDTPAQPNAKTLLIKRKAKADEITATARFAKLDDALGLAFFWAFTSTNSDGTEHYDLQGDQVTDFVKAAMDYMAEAGGAVDEMHDGVATEARVVFAMPLTPDIAKAYGLTTKQYGLMIAIKPTEDQLSKLRDGTYNGVSIAGLGERVPVGKATRRTAKQVVLTDLVDGHQHAIDLDDPASWCGDRLSTTYATSEGADVQHSHVWTFDPQSGAVTVAADSGHTHQVEGTVPASVLAVFALNEQAEAKENAADVLERVLDGEADAGAVSVTIAARAPQNKSTHRTSTSEATDMKTIVLTEAQHAHYSKLSATEQEAFVNKSAAERDAEVQKALDADPIVFKGEKTGIEVHKSQGDFALKIAKQAEENAITMAKQAEEIAKRDTAIRKAAIRKRAAEVLGNMPGDDETHDFIIERLDIEDPKAQKAFETLKGIIATSTIGKRAAGVNGSTETVAVNKQEAYAALKKGLEAFCTEQKIAKAVIWTDGLEAFIATPAGEALHTAYKAFTAAS